MCADGLRNLMTATSIPSDRADTEREYEPSQFGSGSLTRYANKRAPPSPMTTGSGAPTFRGGTSFSLTTVSCSSIEYKWPSG
jgi:hypothetical protein